MQSELKMSEESERKNRKKIKRFDDIYRMLFLVITIMVSFGSNTFEQVNLWTTIGFILISLAIWMIGHAIGAHSLGQETEVASKLLAWSLATLVAPIVFLKFAFKIPTLSYELVAISVLLSIGFTVLPYKWLREALSPTQQRTLLRNLTYFFVLIAYAVLIGVLVL